MACKVVLNPDNTLLVVLRVTKNAINTVSGQIEQTPVTDAVATVTITDEEDVEISGQSWPLTLVHDDNGYYTATISNDADLTDSTPVNVDFLATSGGAQYKAKELIFPVDERVQSGC